MKRFFSLLLSLMLIVPLRADALSTSAKAAVLINGSTGEVIYEQNSKSRLSMASTTKIMTALLLCEHGDFEREITVTDEMLRVEGSSMGLLAGDRVTLHDLLYGLMLSSGNDAANVIAFVLGGTVNGFVKMMNDKVAELGLKDTNFVTPSGLDAEEHFTTASDLAQLTRIAMQNEEFCKAVSCKSAILNYGNPPYKRTLTNHNKLLKTFEGAVGVKTGFTKKSGRCLVSAAKRGESFVIAVTLNDPNDWADHTALLEYGLSAIKIKEIKPPQNQYVVDVIGGDTNSLKVKVETLTVSSLNEGDFHCEVNLPRFLYAPVKKDDIVGTAVYFKDNTIIKTSQLYAESDIKAATPKKSAAKEIKQNLIYIFNGIWEK